MVWVGAVSVECDPNFRLYMVTRLANPTYLPEASTMVNLVNFTITRKVSSMTWQFLAQIQCSIMNTGGLMNTVLVPFQRSGRSSRLKDRDGFA